MVHTRDARNVPVHKKRDKPMRLPPFSPQKFQIADCKLQIASFWVWFEER
jgi:hypothetical protein